MTNLNRKRFLTTLGLGLLGGVGQELQGKIASVAAPELVKSRKPILRVAHLTDIHVEKTATSMKGYEAALQGVNSLKNPVDFIINGGDAIMNAVALTKSRVKEQWEVFHSITKANNSIKMHHCIGNHDLFGWALASTNKEDGKKWARDEYGIAKSYYTIETEKWKFLVLDSIHARHTIPGYFGKIDEEQLNWLAQELENNDQKKFVCVVSHIPILSICSMFDGNQHNKNNWFVPDNTLHADATVLRDLFYKHQNVKTCLSGHIHLIDHVNYLGTDYYCNGAVSGGWWKGEYQQFSPAFVVINFFDDGSTEREIHYYKWK